MSPTQWSWRKSSRSTTNGDCVEVARPDVRRVGIRDSKNPAGGHLQVVPAAFAAFVDQLGKVRS